MSMCGLDECDIYGGCMYDCQYSRAKRGKADAMDKALIADAEKLAQLQQNEYLATGDKDANK